MDKDVDMDMEAAQPWRHHISRHYEELARRLGRKDTHHLAHLAHLARHIAARADRARAEPRHRCATFKHQLELLERERSRLSLEDEAVSKENDALAESVLRSQREAERIDEKRASLRRDVDAFRKELVRTFAAFKVAKVYYKEKLNVHYRRDEERSDETTVVHLEFFTSTRKKSTANSITVSRNASAGTYALLDMNPKLPVFDELAKRLRDTGDISGLLCCVRTCFIRVNAKKS